MKTLRLMSLLWALLGAALFTWAAEEDQTFDIEALEPGGVFWNYETGLGMATNDFVVRFQDAVLTAQRGQFNTKSGDFRVEGAVTLQRDNQVWRGERLQYNRLTRQIQTAEFRAGRAPFYAAGQGLALDLTNKVYTATNAFVTSDDVADPAFRIRAKRLKIAPGKYFEARDAVLYAGGVPVFYFPYLRRNLDRESNHLNAVPGYRSQYGPYLLGSYDWYWDRRLHGDLRLDYRAKRGFGGGPDLVYDAGRWGQGDARFYYLYDWDPQASAPTNAPTIGHNRQRLDVVHQAVWQTNLSVKLVLREQSDAYVTHDFFEAEYRENTQPSSYLEVNRLWPNFSLNLLTRPQINDFFETIERLPDVKLTAVRQPLGISPFYYESDSSLGYFRHNYASGSLSNDFAAVRADTFHQLLLPQTFFGWLNVTPRVGGRFTHYGETKGPGQILSEQDRWVFNTGAEVSFKASRLWPAARSRLLEMDGLRHILQPSLNYAFVPEPSPRPPELPQFDTQLPSLRLLPIVFPDYNSIDAIDSQNVLRLALHNKLQTKRQGEVDNLVNWDLYTDWRLDPRPDQATLADLFSDLDLKPRSWLTLTSEIRFDIENARLRLANHFLTISPNNVWSWSIGNRYLRDSPELGLPQGHNLLLSCLYYRLNENWGFRCSHHYDIRNRIMEEQYYTVYRDFRSWTGALTFRVRDNLNGPTDYGVAFTFSLKAFPRTRLGDDRNKPSLLLGS